MKNQSSNHIFVKKFNKLVLIYCISIVVSVMLYIGPSMDNQADSLLDYFIFIFLVVPCNFIFFIGFILLLFSLFAYLPHKFPLSKIPPDSSLYDAIMSYTVQEGPIKVVFPLIDEDLSHEKSE